MRILNIYAGFDGSHGSEKAFISLTTNLRVSSYIYFFDRERAVS